MRRQRPTRTTVPRVRACPYRSLVSSTLQRSVHAIADAYAGQSSASAMITPAPMPRALRARQATSEVPGAPNSTDEDDDICEPYTIKQGPSTWEFHLTDPTPGVWTLDYSCNWEGAMTAADMTCTVTLDGSWAEVTEPITSASVVPSGEFASIEGAIKTVAIVQASQTPLSSGASPSASGSSASGSRASGSGASGSAAPTPSTGFAPGRPLPTGAMALVGGAAGVFAAALAL
jgi:hypothetical protein